jgi:hydrogenase maturation protease
MESQSSCRVLIIGVGNPFRGDDAAGLLVARRLKERGLDSVEILEHSGEGAALMETWKGVEAVILIDAVDSGAPPGTVHRLEPLRKPLPAAMLRHSTHAFSIPQAVELGAALRQLPARLIVFGIEGRSFQAGTELSSEVTGVMPDVANRVIQEVERLKSQTGSEN